MTFHKVSLFEKYTKSNNVLKYNASEKVIGLKRIS